MKHSGLRFRSLAVGSFVLVVTMATRAETYHVDPNAPAGGGSDWDQALHDLQVALDLAAENPGLDTILVADGTYVPTKLTDSNDVRTATFELTTDLEILGGYAGYSDPDLRDPEQFESVLSGVIPEPMPGPGYVNCPSETGDCFQFPHGKGCENEYCCNRVCNSGDLGPLCCEFEWQEACALQAFQLCPYNLNAYHVVSGVGVDSTATLSGFTIRDGLADGNGRANPAAEITRGGGMHLDYPSITTKELGPAIVQCKFINNYALNDGGAVWSDSGQGEISPRFINCQFIANEADTGNGGAAFMGIGVEDSWVNCLFRDNSAGGDGGAVYEDHVITLTEMVNCTFVRNTADDAGGGGSGGGIHSTNGTEIALTNCIVWLNTPD